MPTDLPATFYAALFTATQTGIAAYNAAIVSGALTGCPKANLIDNRVAGRLIAREGGKMPANYPQVRLTLTGGSESRSNTATFALAAGLPCDAVVPTKITAEMAIFWDKGTIGDSAMTPLVAFIGAGWKAAGYPKFGIPCIRWVEPTDRWKDEQANGSTVTVFRRQITADLQPHLSNFT